MPENKCQEPCTGLARLEQQLSDFQKQNGEDHKELRDRLAQVETTNAVQNAKYDAIMKGLNDLTREHEKLIAKLEALESKPGKRWEGIVDKALWAVCAAVIAFLLGKAGL